MNKTAKNSVIYLHGTVIMAVLGFAGTMILTRVLSQKVYAMYGLLNTFSTAAITLIAFGCDAAYSRFYYEHNRSQKNFIITSLKLPIIIFVIFVLAIIEPSHYIIKYIFEENLPLLTVAIMLIYILFAFIQRFSQITARMEEYAGNYIFSNIIAKSGFILFIIISVVVFKKASFDTVLLSFMLSSIAALSVNIFVLLKTGNNKNISGKSISYKDFLLYGFPYMINNALILVIPVIEKVVIRDLAGWEILGIFTAASIFQTVVLLIVNTLDNIWNPLVYKNYRNTEAFKPILHTFGLMATLIISLGLSACILLRRWLVLLLDSSYYSVYIIAPTVMFGAFFNIIAMIYGVGINISKKTVHYIISPALQAVISILLCYLTIPKLGLIGVGISTLVSIIASRMYRVVVGLYYYDTGTPEFKNIFIYVICAIASVVSMFCTSLTADIIISLSVTALTFITFSKEFKPLLKDVKKLIQTK